MQSNFAPDVLPTTPWGMKKKKSRVKEMVNERGKLSRGRRHMMMDKKGNSPSSFSLMSFDEGWRVSSVFLLPFFVFNHNVSPVRCSLVSLLSFLFLFFSLPVLSLSSSIQLAFHVHLTSVSLTSRVIDNTAQSLWDLSPICSLLLHSSFLSLCMILPSSSPSPSSSSLPLHPDQWSYFCLSFPCLQQEKDCKRIERAGGRIWWKEEDYWSRN